MAIEFKLSYRLVKMADYQADIDEEFTAFKQAFQAFKKSVREFVNRDADNTWPDIVTISNKGIIFTARGKGQPSIVWALTRNVAIDIWGNTTDKDLMLGITSIATQEVSQRLMPEGFNLIEQDHALHIPLDSAEEAEAMQWAKNQGLIPKTEIN